MARVVLRQACNRLADALHNLRMRGLSQKSHIRREVRRTEEDGIDTLRLCDSLQVLQGALCFDLHDEEGIGIGKVCFVVASVARGADP